MVAIRSLLLAGAFAGLTAAAQEKPGRHLLQEAPPPPTGDAQLVNMVQESVQGDVGGLLGAATGVTGALTGISGRRLLQGPPPPVTDQVVAAVTDAGNTVLGGVSGVLTTLELVPPPPARHLLQEGPPPPTGDAQLVNEVQEGVQGDVGGLLGAVTGVTGGLTGISGRHLLQGPPPPVSTQLLGAVTDAGNIVLDGADAALTTLELVPPPPAS